MQAIRSGRTVPVRGDVSEPPEGKRSRERPPVRISEQGQFASRPRPVEYRWWLAENSSRGDDTSQPQQAEGATAACRSQSAAWQRTRTTGARAFLRSASRGGKCREGLGSRPRRGKTRPAGFGTKEQLQRD